MASTIIRAQLTFGFTCAEDHGGAPSGVVIESPFTAYNDSLPMLPTDTPPAALLSIYKTTIGAGFTIDLTAAQGSNGNVNGSGKRIQAIRVSNPSASIANVTIATGVSNGHVIPASVVVPPGGEALLFYNDYGVDIDGTHKTLDVSGNAADTPEIGILLG
jgi:hypothetical protein